MKVKNLIGNHVTQKKRRTDELKVIKQKSNSLQGCEKLFACEAHETKKKFPLAKPKP